MITDFKKALKITLRFEGGYVNHPADPGGATNYGITNKTYDQFIGTHKDVRDIPMDIVEKIYYRNYWLKAGCEGMSWPLNLLVFDFAVHSGVNRAVKELQTLLDMDIDGIVGRNTLQAISNKEIQALCEDYLDRREDFLEGLVYTKPNLKVFLRGWLNRINQLRAHC